MTWESSNCAHQVIKGRISFSNLVELSLALVAQILKSTKILEIITFENTLVYGID
jgi:hypothetical protein